MNLIVNKANNLRTESKMYYGSAKKVKATTATRKLIIVCFIVLIILVLVLN